MNDTLEQADNLLLSSGLDFHPDDCEQNGDVVTYFSDETDNRVVVNTADYSVTLHTPHGVTKNETKFVSTLSRKYIDSVLLYNGDVEFFIDNTGRHNDPIEGAEQVRFSGRTFNIPQRPVDIKIEKGFLLPYLEEVEGEPAYRKQATVKNIHIWTTTDGRLILEN